MSYSPPANTNLFDSTQLTNQPARGVGIALGVISPLLLMGLGKSWSTGDKSNVHFPRPMLCLAAFIFAAVAWLLSMTVASMQFEVWAMVLILVFSFLVLVKMIIFLWRNKYRNANFEQRQINSGLIYSSCLSALVMVIVGATGQPTSDIQGVNAFISIMVLPLFAWLGFAGVCCLVDEGASKTAYVSASSAAKKK